MATKGTQLLVFLLLVASYQSTYAGSWVDKIKHVIVLMEENRSFDHMLGFYPGVNGLTGKECNYVDPTDLSSTKVCVNQVSPLVAPCDPDHGTNATTYKIFGQSNATNNATMSGFVGWENTRGNANTSYCDVMSMLTPEHVPIISTLASEFVLFDRFFCAHPGPTWPNRLFTLTATSAGLTETGPWYHNKLGQMFPQKTFFDQVSSEGLQWRLYYNDTPWEMFVEGIAHNPENLVSMEQFFDDAKTGNLPSYAWINPRSGFNLTLNQGSNDQHPDHDVALGEQYMKDIYEALRASPQWNETLFIITYDEHGGYYDHQAPPMKGIPGPGDGEASYPDPGFMFDRLGIRIPTLLISPWVPKGLVVSDPPASQKPTNTSEYTLTSIMATARKLLGMQSGALTKRDGWSATFEQVLNLTEARTDCPMHLPPAPPPSANYDPKQEYLMPINDLQRTIMTVHATLNEEVIPDHITLQGHVSEYLQEQFNKHKERTLNWKKSKKVNDDPTNYLILALPAATHWISTNWEINKGNLSTYYTLSLRNSTPALCLDSGISKNGLSKDNVIQASVSNCYPSSNPDTNRDPAQQWIWASDSTIRPNQYPNMCLTGAVLENDNRVYLQPCTKTVEQYWAFHGDDDGDYSGGGIVFSEWTLGIVNKTNTNTNTNTKPANLVSKIQA